MVCLLQQEVKWNKSAADVSLVIFFNNNQDSKKIWVLARSEHYNFPCLPGACGSWLGIQISARVILTEFLIAPFSAEQYGQIRGICSVSQSLSGINLQFWAWPGFNKCQFAASFWPVLFLVWALGLLPRALCTTKSPWQCWGLLWSPGRLLCWPVPSFRWLVRVLLSCCSFWIVHLHLAWLEVHLPSHSWKKHWHLIKQTCTETVPCEGAGSSSVTGDGWAVIFSAIVTYHAESPWCLLTLSPFLRIIFSWTFSRSTSIYVIFLYLPADTSNSLKHLW